MLLWFLVGVIIRDSISLLELLLGFGVVFDWLWLRWGKCLPFNRLLHLLLLLLNRRGRHLSLLCRLRSRWLPPKLRWLMHRSFFDMFYRARSWNWCWWLFSLIARLRCALTYWFRLRRSSLLSCIWRPLVLIEDGLFFPLWSISSGFSSLLPSALLFRLFRFLDYVYGLQWNPKPRFLSFSNYCFIFTLKP